MTELVLSGSLVLQCLALLAIITSRRIAPTLRAPALLLILGFTAALGAQLAASLFSDQAGLNSGLSLISTLFLAAAVLHFVLSLCAPRFVHSVNYWCVQTLLAISALSCSTLISDGTPTAGSLLASFSRGFGWATISACAALLLFVLFPARSASRDSVISFRIRSMRRMLLWSLALSLLLLFSIPATPAVATASAAWCSCFAAAGTSYLIAERRLFLYDATRRAISAPGQPLADESITLAASTLNSLSDLLSPQKLANADRSESRAAPVGPREIPLMISQLRSVTLPDALTSVSRSEHELLDHIHYSHDEESDRLFERLLTIETDEAHVITFDSMRSQIASLTTLSRAHFGVDIVGNSLQMMELISRMREEGPESRITVISGERGTGKHLFAQALHNLRGNRRMFHLDLPESEDPAELESALESLDLDLSGERRDTLTIAIPGSRFSPLASYLEHLTVIQSKIADTILLVQEPSDRSAREATGQLVDAFTLHIPPLRERFEDMVFQAIWFMDEFSRKRGLNLRGIEASALRAALINRWRINTQELFDSISLVLSFGKIPVSGTIATFIIPDPSPEREIKEGWATLRSTLQEIFLQLGSHPHPVASRLGISVDFVHLLAQRLQLSLIDQARDEDLFT